MSIKTTSYITRQEGLERVIEIVGHMKDNNHRAIEKISYESVESLKEVIADLKPNFDYYLEMCKDNKMSDKELGNLMDMPFIRHSIFDNYLVRDN